MVEPSNLEPVTRMVERYYCWHLTCAQAVCCEHYNFVGSLPKVSSLETLHYSALERVMHFESASADAQTHTQTDTQKAITKTKTDRLTDKQTNERTGTAMTSHTRGDNDSAKCHQDREPHKHK